MRTLSFLTLFAWITFHAGFAGADAQPLDRIVAVVNDDVITSVELERRVEFLSKQMADRRLPPRDALRQQVLERLILEKLQLQIADSTGVKVDDETLNASIRRIAEENRLSLGEFRDTLEREGFKFIEFREDIRREITLRRLQERQVAKTVMVTEQEVDEYLQKAGALNDPNTEYKIAHILIALPEASSPEQLTKARERMQRVVDELAKGREFSELAIAYSDGQQALSGGELDWRPASALPTLFTAVVPTLKEGQVSDIIRAPNGFHLVKLLEKRGQQRHITTQAHIRHIMLKPSTLRSDEDAAMQLRDIRRQILAGADFGKLAREVSEDNTTAAEGGDLGWVNNEELVSQFTESITKLAPNELSEPIKSQFGWHLAQILERREYDATDEFRRNQARRLVREKRLEEATDLWLRRLRDEAYVDIRMQANS